ncbi:Kunitz/Bovine pancreatic trypsin inhibitor domain protein, partial [Ostertagia ostertagi]
DCDDDNWIIRAYFEPNKNGCKRIWWGGCVTQNKNLWSSMAECQRACAHRIETPPPPVPQETQKRALEMTTSSKGITTYPMSSMSLFAADAPLTPPRANSDSFTVVYPHQATFSLPLNLKKSSTVPWFQLRVTATVMTRRIISKQPRVHFTFASTSNAAATATSAPPTVTSTPLTTVTRSTRTAASAPNDAPEETRLRRLSSGSPAGQLAFRSDLNQQLANEKRRLENRADLAYSSLFNHPVTVACMFLTIFFMV